MLAVLAADSYRQGDSDREIRSFYGELLADLPAAALVLLPQSRHFATQDQPQAVSAAIEAFVDALHLRQAPGGT